MTVEYRSPNGTYYVERSVLRGGVWMVKRVGLGYPVQVHMSLAAAVAACDEAYRMTLSGEPSNRSPYR